MLKLFFNCFRFANKKDILFCLGSRKADIGNDSEDDDDGSIDDGRDGNDSEHDYESMMVMIMIVISCDGGEDDNGSDYDMVVVMIMIVIIM